MQMRMWAAAVAGVLVIGGAGCTGPLHVVSLAPAPADTLAFAIADAGGRATIAEPIAGLSVTSCGVEHAYWTISADGSRTMPNRVVYGVPVPGFPARVGPLPLTPGCYDVIVSDSRPLRFYVDAAGHAHLSPSGP